MVKEKRPNILFLMETKCPQCKMEGIRVKLGFNGLFVVEPVDQSGGLALLWRETQALEIQNFTRRHINVIVKEADNKVFWKLTCFYGYLVATKRHESWALLEHLKIFQPQPWVCIRDFNEILTQEEKTRPVVRKERQMDQFRNALEACQLKDLGYKGAMHMWNNGRHDGNFIKERLDRAMANREWLALFREVIVFVLAARASGHKPLLLQLTHHDSEADSEFVRSFKFEAKWQ